MDPGLPGSKSGPLLAASYLFHGAVQNLLPEAHLDSNHEGSGAADSSQQALGDHGDVGVGPAEGVEQRGGSMDALRQGAGDRAQKVRVRGACPGPHPHATTPLPAIDSNCSCWLCRSYSKSGSHAGHRASGYPKLGGRGRNQKRLRLLSSSMGPLCDSSFPLGVGWRECL